MDWKRSGREKVIGAQLVGESKKFGKRKAKRYIKPKGILGIYKEIGTRKIKSFN